MGDAKSMQIRQGSSGQVANPELVVYRRQMAKAPIVTDFLA